MKTNLCRPVGKCNCYGYKLDSRHRPIMGIYNKLPCVNTTAFVAPNAAVIGDVKLASGSSVWYNAVVRGILLVHYGLFCR